MRPPEKQQTSIIPSVNAYKTHLKVSRIMSSRRPLCRLKGHLPTAPNKKSSSLANTTINIPYYWLGRPRISSQEMTGFGQFSTTGFPHGAAGPHHHYFFTTNSGDNVIRGRKEKQETCSSLEDHVAFF